MGEQDVWARGESRLREVLTAVEAELRASRPELSIRVRSSRDERSPLHVVAEFWEGAGYEIVFSVLFTWLPAPHGLRGALVCRVTLDDQASSGFLCERPESPLPDSLGLDPTDDEIRESIEEAIAFARRCGAIIANEPP